MTERLGPHDHTVQSEPQAPRAAGDMGLTDLPTGALPMSGVQLEEWRVELDRFLGELSEQSSAALEALARCRSAAEVLEVEYAWLGARSKIYANAGERFAQVCAEIAQGLSRMEQGQTPF